MHLRTVILSCVGVDVDVDVGVGVGVADRGIIDCWKHLGPIPHGLHAGVCVPFSLSFSLSLPRSLPRSLPGDLPSPFLPFPVPSLRGEGQQEAMLLAMVHSSDMRVRSLVCDRLHWRCSKQRV